MTGPAGLVAWPLAMTCGDCGAPARAYPYPMFEDQVDFEEPEFEGGRSSGTLWCMRCSPSWGEYLLQQMVIRSIAQGPTGYHPEPSMPLLGGLPAEQIAFLETELADFLDAPGPLSTLRPHWFGEGPIAPRGEAFAWACADLVSFMRDARLVGFVHWAAA